MKLARLVKNGTETFGVISGDKVATKEDIMYQTGVPIPLSIKDFVFGGWLDEVRDKVSYVQNLSEFEIMAPIPNPPKIACLAFNYSAHAKEQGMESSKDPVIVLKPRTALTGPYSEIQCPDFIGKLDYEIELALIIGRNCKNVPEDAVQDVISGYMILNDVSARDIQFSDGQFGRAKGADTFAPCGPWITTSDEITDPQNLAMATMVNGETRQDANTAEMHIKIPQIVSRLSKIMTLERGDIISTGTPEGVAMNNKYGYLKDGDNIQMSIDGLGTISNTVRFVKSD